MEMGNVPNTIRDPRAGVTYVVMAYRELTREEVLLTIRMHLASAAQKPKRGSRVVIYSSLGAI